MVDIEFNFDNATMMYVFCVSVRMCVRAPARVFR